MNTKASLEWYADHAGWYMESDIPSDVSINMCPLLVARRFWGELGGVKRYQRRITPGGLCYLKELNTH